MADSPKPLRTGPRAAPSGRGSTTRKPEQAGSVLPVSNPMDLWHLCQKAGHAEAHPMRNSKGWPMYQRSVTQWVHQDNDNMKQAWPKTVRLELSGLESPSSQHDDGRVYGTN